MNKSKLYDRITLEGIEALINPQKKTIKLGEGSIKNSRLDTTILLINLPGIEDKKNTILLGGNNDANDFLFTVNQYLTESGLYIAEVEFTKQKWHGLKPYNLNGTFYRQKKYS